jgi:hypothetical protein
VTPSDTDLNISATFRSVSGAACVRLAILTAALVVALGFATTGRAGTETSIADSASALVPESCEGTACNPIPEESSGAGVDTAGTGDTSGTTPDASGPPAPSPDEGAAPDGSTEAPPPETSPGAEEPPATIPPAEPDPSAPPIGSEPTVPVTEPDAGPPPGTGPSSTPSVPPPLAPVPTPDAAPAGALGLTATFVSSPLVGFSSPSFASRELPAQSGGRAKTSSGPSDGMRGKSNLPGGPTGPSAPSPVPAGAAGGSSGGLFFSGFAALVAAISFGVARRSSGRLTLSVALGQPVALVSLPERPG